MYDICLQDIGEVEAGSQGLGDGGLACKSYNHKKAVEVEVPGGITKGGVQARTLMQVWQTAHKVMFTCPGA